MGFILNCVYGLAILAALPWIVLRSVRTGRYRAGWKEKFLGLVSRTTDSKPVVWLHAVSVGEVQLLRTIVTGIESRYPDCQLCISTTTRAGMELAEKAFSKRAVFYLPLDFTWAVRNAMQRIQPHLLVLVELEVWPNLMKAAKRSNCAVVIVNGRLSKRSFEGYARFGWLTRSFFSKLDLIAVQDATYAERFKALGAPAERVVETGNLKFDGATSDRNHPEVLLRKTQLGLTSQHLVWVVGSTQAPEEAYAIDAFRRLHTKFPQCKMIVVPRQPDRFDEVARFLENSGFPFARRSQAVDVSQQPWDILLADSVGELRWWWGMADIGFVGGSFGDRGGQNMIEPAALGVSTAVGPNTKNFADSVRILLEAKGLTQLERPEELYEWALANLDSEEHRQSIGLHASETASAHRGALERTLNAIEPWMRNPSQNDNLPKSGGK